MSHLPRSCVVQYRRTLSPMIAFLGAFCCQAVRLRSVAPKATGHDPLQESRAAMASARDL